MKYASIGLAVIAAFCGLVAAFYWYKSSIVPIDPGWAEDNPEPVISERRLMDWDSAMMTSITTSANLNKTAAIWTACSVAFGSAASLLGSLT